MIVPLDGVAQHGEPAHQGLLAVGRERGGWAAGPTEPEAVRSRNHSRRRRRRGARVGAARRLVARQLQRTQRVRLLRGSQGVLLHTLSLAFAKLQTESRPLDGDQTSADHSPSQSCSSRASCPCAGRPTAAAIVSPRSPAATGSRRRAATARPARAPWASARGTSAPPLGAAAPILRNTDQSASIQRGSTVYTKK